MDSKINKLLKDWSKGSVATSPWLQEHGVYRQLVRRYVASGWLKPLGRGAFLRAGETADWLGGLNALQQQLGMNVYPGAVTALSLKGLGHFLPMGGGEEVHLFSDQRKRLPAWFMHHEWGVRIQYEWPRLFGSSDPATFTEVKHGDFPVRISAPERAILEVLHMATSNGAIDHAVELMGGLSTLRPQLLQALLEDCRSLRVKRLFLWAAESAGHEWFSRLATENLDLGKGKRSLYRGGRFDPKYRITVPRGKEAAHV